MKPIRLFPKLESIDDFVIKTFPVYHPDTRDYALYWEEQEKYCVEGKWGKDGSKYRFCTPGLYYYVNFTVIEDENDKKSRELIRPRLRDIDWYINYGWFVARGFSGFEDDEEYTCNIIVRKLNNNLQLTPAEKKALSSAKFITKSDGSYKTYIDAREYLYGGCPAPMGRAIYDNPSRNLFLLATRALGKSYTVANAVLGHEFTFYGKKTYDEYIKEGAIGSQTFVGASLSTKSSDLLKKFTLTQEYNKTHNGAWGAGDELIPGFFYRNCSGTLGPNNAKSVFTHSYEVKEGGVKRKIGSGATVYHGIYTTDNPNAAVGTRPTVMIIEEVGLLENVVQVHLNNEQCQFTKTKFGSSFYLGTGGDIDKILGPKILFENPKEHQFVDYPDLWEDRQSPIGMFIPAYYGNSLFVDELGNTDIEASFEQELHERSLREKSNNSSALDGYRMSRPLIPSEMFLTKASFVFPVIQLREREVELDVRKIWEKNVSIGDLEWGDVNKKSVTWKEDLSNYRLSKVINTLNLDMFQEDLIGKIAIYEHPHIDIPDPNHVRSLYKVVYDPIQDDEYGTSLASVLVHKGYTNLYNEGLQNTIVAEWIGRYDQINDNHLMAIKLALYYNAKILFENNLPNFKTFCKMEGYVNMLQRTPWEAIKDSVKDPSRKNDHGVAMSTPLKINTELLIRQHLLEPFLKTETKMLTNIDNLYSLRLVRELASYFREGNFDHVSSYKILMLWLSQEKKKVYTEDDISVKTKFKDQLLEYQKQQQKITQHETQYWHTY